MTAHLPPSPEALEFVQRLRELLRCCNCLTEVELSGIASVFDAQLAPMRREHADLREQNGRLKKALHVKSESEKALYGQLRIRNDMLEALTVYGWTVKYNDTALDRFWDWRQPPYGGRGPQNFYLTGRRSDGPSWHESARKALAEQRERMK